VDREEKAVPLCRALRSAKGALSAGMTVTGEAVGGVMRPGTKADSVPLCSHAEEAKSISV